MGNRQEYLYDGEYVTIAYDVTDKPDLVIVVNDREELIVAPRDRLEKKEDSWGYKRAQERAEELRLLTARAEEKYGELCERVMRSACESLATRVKINAVFGAKGGDSTIAMAIADQLDKLVEEKAKRVIKESLKDEDTVS